MESQFLFQLDEKQFRSLIKETFIEVLKEEGIYNERADALLGIQEAAALLNLAVKTLYEKTSERSIPHYKHGKKIVFKKSELLALVELFSDRSDPGFFSPGIRKD